MNKPTISELYIVKNNIKKTPAKILEDLFCFNILCITCSPQVSLKKSLPRAVAGQCAWHLPIKETKFKVFQRALGAKITLYQRLPHRRQYDVIFTPCVRWDVTFTLKYQGISCLKHAF